MERGRDVAFEQPAEEAQQERRPAGQDGMRGIDAGGALHGSGHAATTADRKVTNAMPPSTTRLVMRLVVPPGRMDC